MACCADVVVVCADAQFALTETTLGIPPAQIAPFVADRLGLRTARRLMLTAARFNGSDALALGLADFVAADAAALNRWKSTSAAGAQMRAGCECSDQGICSPRAGSIAKGCWTRRPLLPVA